VTSTSATVFRAPGRPRSQAVIVAAGLNNRPEALHPLIETLNRCGYDCVRVAFRFGQHRTSDAIAHDWVSALSEAYARSRRQYASEHIHAAVYSLGALVTLTFLQRHEAAHLNRLFLIAPPLALTRPARLLRYVTPLRAIGAALPSLAPRDVRARSVTSLADYHAMLTLIDGLDRGPLPPNIRRAPTLVVMGANDEFVDTRGVREWIRRHELPWATRVIDKDPAGTAPRHLLLSELAVGPAGWGVLTGELIAHLGQQAPPQCKLSIDGTSAT
jgi:esterase/lipase